MGVILSVRFRRIPRYDVAETIVTCATLDEVLAQEEQFPLQLSHSASLVLFRAASCRDADFSEPRVPFLAMASFLGRSMAKRFQARLHWGKYFPLSGAEIESLYPALEEFRSLCRRIDPHGVFRNEFADRVLFGRSGNSL